MWTIVDNYNKFIDSKFGNSVYQFRWQDYFNSFRQILAQTHRLRGHTISQTLYLKTYFKRQFTTRHILRDNSRLSAKFGTPHTENWD